MNTTELVAEMSRTGLNFFRSHFDYKFISVHSCEDRLYLTKLSF